MITLFTVKKVDIDNYHLGEVENPEEVYDLIVAEGYPLDGDDKEEFINRVENQEKDKANTFTFWNTEKPNQRFIVVRED